jgi:large subunit ribosomal protein L21
MSYAVVRTGGKQVRVAPGDAVRVETLAGDVGDTIEFSEVLLVNDGKGTTVGSPLVSGAKVVGKITAQGRGPKIRIFKMKRRKGYRRRAGHRQNYTEVTVDSVNA